MSTWGPIPEGIACGAMMPISLVKKRWRSQKNWMKKTKPIDNVRRHWKLQTSNKVACNVVLIRPNQQNFSVDALGPMNLDLDANMNQLWQLATAVSGKHRWKCFINLGLTGVNISWYSIGALWLLRAWFHPIFPPLHLLVGVGSYISSQSQSGSSQSVSQHFLSVWVQLRDWVFPS